MQTIYRLLINVADCRSSNGSSKTKGQNDNGQSSEGNYHCAEASVCAGDLCLFRAGSACSGGRRDWSSLHVANEWVVLVVVV